MVSDPYKVLGVSRDATKDEIKSAYRKKAKQYHPDLHPDDPIAAEKMNEVNEAYDMLNNPEKYSRYTQYQQQQSSYNNAQNSNDPYRGYQNTSQSDWQYWSFDDLFGFGRFNQYHHYVQETVYDMEDIRNAIHYINNRQYAAAVAILNSVVNARRDARWYFLSAIANNGAGSQVLALEHIRKAIELDPQNMEYQKTLQNLYQSGNHYQSQGAPYQNSMSELNKMCSSFFLFYFLCMFCRCY